MSKARSGGGITSNKLVSSRAPKPEPKAKAISPCAVSQIGNKQGNHATDKGTVRTRTEPLVTGRGYQPVGPTRNMGQGPGANRTFHRSGSQSSTPTARPMATGRDMLAFGPERSKG
jgi:hypothetical protein